MDIINKCSPSKYRDLSITTLYQLMEINYHYNPLLQATWDNKCSLVIVLINHKIPLRLRVLTNLMFNNPDLIILNI